MLMVAESMAKWGARSEYGPFPEPFKAAWSKRHSGVLVACRRGVSLVSLPSGTKRLLQGLTSHQYTDIGERNGSVAMASRSDDGKGGMVKVIADDLSRNRLVFQTSGEFPSRICLTPEGKAIVALETTVGGLAKTRFAVAILDGGEAGGYTGSFDGSVVSLFHDDNFGMSFAAFSSGAVVCITVDGSSASASSAGTVPGGIVAAKGGLVSGMSKAGFGQQAARVFVGSRPGSNDRWDSGPVRTSIASMAYGGGDNLAPGHKYWATILVQGDGVGWSDPFVKEFVAPIM
jgi:hypothetical protein